MSETDDLDLQCFQKMINVEAAGQGLIGPPHEKTCLRGFKPVPSATETRKKIEISPKASLHMILFKK